MEDRPRYDTGPAATPEPPPTPAKLVAAAHAHRQGIPSETSDPWLERLPERLRALADLVLGGKMHAGEVACAVAVPMDSIENALAAMERNLH